MIPARSSVRVCCDWGFAHSRAPSFRGYPGGWCPDANGVANDIDRSGATPLGEWPLLSNKASKAGISAAVIALRRISERGAWSVQTRILGAFTLDGARFSSAGSV